MQNSTWARAALTILIIIAVVTVSVLVVMGFTDSGTKQESTDGDRADGIVIVDGAGATDVPLDPVGQAIGDFEPLVIPTGLTVGVGVTVPNEQRTQPGSALMVGDVLVANAAQTKTGTNPYLLVAVDEITYPIVGEERSAVFHAAGVPDDGTRVVQKVIVRVRQVGGADSDAWVMGYSIVAVNGRLDAMTVANTDSCQAGTILSGHGTATNDTVQGCFYAIGTVATPGSPISNISVVSRVDDAEQRLYVQSDVARVYDLGHSHEHEEGDYEYDNETGERLSQD